MDGASASLPLNFGLVLSAVGIARCENRMNAREQIVLATWFGQIADRAGPERALPSPFIGIGSDEDRGNGRTGRDQSIVKFGPGHPRHLYVRDHAGNAAATPGF